MILFVTELTIVLFCFRFFVYNCIVGDSWSLDMSVFQSRISWEKVVNVSFPMRDNKGSKVNGVQCTWLRWFAFLSMITWTIRFGSSIILNCKFLANLLVSFHFIDVSVTMSTFFKLVLLKLIVRYLIFLLIDMTCSIFWLLIFCFWWKFLSQYSMPQHFWWGVSFLILSSFSYPFYNCSCQLKIIFNF